MPRLGYASGTADKSIYGQGVVGSQLTGGVTMNNEEENNQPFGLQYGYGSAVSSKQAGRGTATNMYIDLVQSGSIGGSTDADKEMEQLCRFDPDLASGTFVAAYKVSLTENGAGTALTGSDLIDHSERGVRHLVVSSDNAVTVDGADRKRGVMRAAEAGKDLLQVRRLNQLSGSHREDITTSTSVALLIFTGSTAGTLQNLADNTHDLHFISADNFLTGSGLGSLVGADSWGLEGEADIPEIEIKVDSVSVTARTKKLKAKWTPELGQDLNAYHNLDAEVELTSILSEQIALEIDREILADLINGATAATYYWSRSPGLFVNRQTGLELGAASAAPDFTGTVSEWYETLIETINDVSAQIHRKTLRGGANFIVCGPEVANILEFTSGFRANVSHEDTKGTIGAVNVGSISKKFDVMVDPYFPRSAILVGRKGNSFLESGYVYAPYVPLQTTPTIFGTEDFVPRKGVMTRYAKKMVRPDMYGLVICRGLLGEEGSTS